MKTILALFPVLALLGCTSYPAPDSSTHVPSPAELEGGDCHMQAQEHLVESAWQSTNTADQQRVYAAMLSDCQQWKSNYAWKDAAQ